MGLLQQGEGLGAVLGDAEVAVKIGFAEAGLGFGVALLRLGLDLRQRYRCVCGEPSTPCWGCACSASSSSPPG